MTLHIDLALQGGGSHGAYTWGVLDRLLEEDDLWIAGISGTSAGAMNAVALAAGYQEGGREGARACLRRFWEQVGERSPFAALVEAGLSANPWLGEWTRSVSALMSRGAAQALSPYTTNPFNLNPLRRILEDTIDFERVRACSDISLFISATQVSTGGLRVFGQQELSVEVVLASACLPMMFQAIEIEGEAYWDGGYAGNPSLMPLIEQTDANDLILVQINPLSRPDTPVHAPEIVDRISEITFNASLLKELKMIHLLQRLIREERLSADEVEPSRMTHLKSGLMGADPQRERPIHSLLFRRIAALNIHRIDGGEHLLDLGAASKLRTDIGFLEQLFDLGRQTTEDWLRAHRHDVGRRSSLSLEAVCGW